MPGSILERLPNFGEIAAETDFNPEFFIPSSSWRNILDRRHPIVAGRKGTGKTALRLALRDHAASHSNIFARDLAFREYPWNVHHAVFPEGASGRSRYVETWLFLMLVELAKLSVGANQAIPDTSARKR